MQDRHILGYCVLNNHLSFLSIAEGFEILFDKEVPIELR